MALNTLWHSHTISPLSDDHIGPCRPDSRGDREGCSEPNDYYWQQPQAQENLALHIQVCERERLDDKGCKHGHHHCRCGALEMTCQTQLKI